MANEPTIHTEEYRDTRGALDAALEAVKTAKARHSQLSAELGKSEPSTAPEQLQLEDDLAQARRDLQERRVEAERAAQGYGEARRGAHLPRLDH